MGRSSKKKMATHSALKSPIGNPPITEQQEESLLADLEAGRLNHRLLEQKVDSFSAVKVRREFIEKVGNVDLDGIPFEDYNYKEVNGACCENLIGFTPIPTGVVGPLKINGEILYIPMATTEGALIASTSRGCKALMENGVTSHVINDGMTRAPVLKFPNIASAMLVLNIPNVMFSECLNWLKKPTNFQKLKTEFELTSRYCRLIEIDPDMNGDYLYLRFVATTGDAMGMNMVSKATSAAVDCLLKEFKESKLISLSGNTCADKKASAVNWIKGRGKSVVAEAVVSAENVQSVLKCDVKSLVELANAKLQVGSSSAITIGGWNAHAANVVAAIFLATGQDAAQVVSSSMCSTQLNATEDDDLRISCTMKCVEVGTVGGGTILGSQMTALKMLRCMGSSEVPGDNARRLAQIICGAVLAGELSLLAAQCSNDLVRSHMKLNRSSRDFATLPQLSAVPPALPSEVDRMVRRMTKEMGCSHIL